MPSFPTNAMCILQNDFTKHRLEHSPITVFALVPERNWAFSFVTFLLSPCVTFVTRLV